ncbi:MAG: ribbon-helix-helix protein, CopG family [Chloroflexi bacterium]|nr:ribbon-helix-helix protein, CopG family [Chloroflexota bacterium]
MPPRRISRTITFSLPPEMYQEVQRVKEEEGRDMSELVREALRLYMEDRELRREQRRQRLRSRQNEGS